MRRLGDSSDVEATPLVNPAAAAAAAAAAAGGGGTLSPAGGRDSFDASMVIILAALLCVLICALGLNSVIRCALHCGRRLAPPAAGVVTVTAAAARSSVQEGLKKKALRRIPVEVYRPKSGIPAATECAICLGEFAHGEKVRVLPRCHHGFHVRCIDTWLATHSSCPTCRDSLVDDDGGAAAERGRSYVTDL